MSTLQERLIAERKKLLKQGKPTGERELVETIVEMLEGRKAEIEGEMKTRRRIATNMLNRKFDDKIILEITGIDKVELDKLKIK